MIEARLDLIERFRLDIVAHLAMAWRGEDLCAPIEFCLAIAKAPSPTKDALSTKLLDGELIRDRGGLKGALELTADGRYLVRRLRARFRGETGAKEAFG